MKETKMHEIAVEAKILEKNRTIVARYGNRDVAFVSYDDTKYFEGCEGWTIMLLSICCGIGVCIDQCCILPKYRRKKILEAMSELNDKAVNYFAFHYGLPKDEISIEFYFDDDKLNKALDEQSRLLDKGKHNYGIFKSVDEERKQNHTERKNTVSLNRL